MVAAVRGLAIIGSGETSPTMVTVHRELIARLGLAGPQAIVLATPYASIAGTVSGQHVQVNCRLTVGSFTGLTRSIGFETGPGALSEQGAIPLVLAAPASAAAQTAKVDCWTVSSSSPSVVRFSPKFPGVSSRPSRSPQNL